MKTIGKIIDYKVLTLENDLKISSKFEPDCKSSVIEKHNLAEKNDRYIVRFKLLSDDSIDENFYNIIQVFIPKTIIDNDLIENGSKISYDDETCYLLITEIEDFFDRAKNGATIIKDSIKKQMKN